MIQRFALILTVVFWGEFFAVGTAQAQLTREWSFDLSTLGPGSYSKKTVIVDDSGNAYVMSMPGVALAGVRVTKIKPDSTIEWQVDHLQAGLYPDYFGRSTAGDFYVAGHNAIEGGWTVSATGVKFTSTGSFAWATTVTPVNAPRFGFSHAIASVDSDGNLWLGINESPTDSFCIDSFPWQGQPTGSSGEMFQGVLYRLESSSGSAQEVDRFDGGTRRPGGVYQIVADNEGFVDVQALFFDFCCNDFCQGCGDSCFTRYGALDIPFPMRSTFYLRRYSNGGGYSGSTYLAASDDELYSTKLLSGRFGELYTVTHRYMSPPPYWTYISRFGDWTTPFPGELIEGDRIAFDYDGNLYSILYVEQSNAATLRSIDGATGAVRWTEITNWGTLGVDRGGHALVKDNSNNLHKYDVLGNELWTYSPGYNIGDWLHADTLDNLYYVNYQTLYKFRTTKDLVLRDANNDSIPNVEFELIKVRNNPPLFTEDTLATFTTDDMGRLRFDLLPENKFLFEHDLGEDTLAVEDTVKIAKHVFSEPARKHEAVLGTMYSVHLDNMQIDGDGSVSFLVLDEMVEQEVLMNHTEYRYNLLVSVEWDAEAAYLQGVQRSFRAASGFLYDVSDGQIRFDTIMLFDNDNFQAEADVRILATNMHNPDAMPNGIFQAGFCGTWHCGYPMTLPRKWYGGPAVDRDSTYARHPLSSPVSNDYRTVVHEFGHYALAFRDEYKFYDASWNELDPAVARCQPRPAGNYGFMDSQYDGFVSSVHASEMSSRYRYVDPACQNTAQFMTYNLSCWDFLESWAEGPRGIDQILVPILKPDLSGEPERQPTPGYDYIIGPNDNLAAPDYNVDTLVIFPEGISAPPVTARSLHVLVDGVPAGGALVSLMKPDFEGGYFAVIQGNTTDLGLIWVLGADRLRDYIYASAHSWSYTTPPGLASASSNYRKSWLFGELELSSAGDGDSVTVQLSTLSGDLPMIASLTCDANSSATVVLETSSSFTGLPSVTFMSAGHENIVDTLATVSGGYGTTVTGALGSEGMLRFHAEDDQQRPFFFDASYSIRGSGRIGHIVSGPGMVTVELDTANTAVERVALVSSAYPCPTAGLGSEAIQGGQTQALTVTPEQTLSGHNNIRIYYTDAELSVVGGAIGVESTLQLYSWDSDLDEWVLLGGVVDTVENIVSGQIPGAGVYAAFTSNVITDVEDDEHGEVLPYRFELSQNYPNPFNPVTTIEYSVPSRTDVTIEIFNVLGQKVRTLVNETKSAGAYRTEWNGNDDSGKPVSTGVYLYRFTVDDIVQTKKMLLLK